MTKKIVSQNFKINLNFFGFNYKLYYNFADKVKLRRKKKLRKREF